MAIHPTLRTTQVVLTVIAMLCTSFQAPGTAAADDPSKALTFMLTRDGRPASSAIVLISVPGQAGAALTATSDRDGVVHIPFDRLLTVATPKVVANDNVNILIRAYQPDEPVNHVGTHLVHAAYIGFAFDTADMAIRNYGIQGGMFALTKQKMAFTDVSTDCSLDPTAPWVTCDIQNYFDADLRSIEVPISINYGGGKDWASTLAISRSKSVQTDHYIKVNGGAWAKAEGKLSTSESDTVTLSTPETAPIGNVKNGRASTNVAEEWEFVRTVTKICGFGSFFCTTDSEVRPWEWTGSLHISSPTSPVSPYDMAGPPSSENLNCTRMYSTDMSTATGHDTSLTGLMNFSADGGFRDEMGVEVEWSVKIGAADEFNHTYKIVGSTEPRHFLFAYNGLAIFGTDNEPTCPEDGIHMTYTDASTRDLTNVGLDMPTSDGGSCPPEAPRQVQEALCGVRRR
jgi:hypothetical protein